MWTDGVQAVRVPALEQAAVMSHQPDDQLAARFDAGVDGRLLNVCRLAVLGVDEEIDLRMRFDPWVDLAGTCGELIALR